MAGSLPGIANTQRVDQQGKPLVGGKLYLFTAGTITPATAYKDFNLTTGQEFPNPIVLDEWGQIPPFYVADGYYRARLTNASGGTVLFDETQIPAVGNNTSGGGGGGSTVDPTALIQTGFELFLRRTGSLTGYVRGNGRTIGNASSGASERADNDCQALFEYYWNNFNDTLNPVVGGRGRPLRRDWAAGKQITLPDYKGKSIIGANQMGSGTDGSNTDSSFSTPDTVGSSGGAATKTIVKANLPNTTFAVTIPAGQGSHSHANDALKDNTSSTSPGGATSIPSGGVAATINNATLPAMSGTAASGGSGTALGNISPSVVVTCYIKL